MRIGSLSDPVIVNAQYRARFPLNVLARQGHEVLANADNAPMPAERLNGCDVVHIHRITTPEMQQVAHRLRERGIAIVWDDDDDVTAVPRTNPLYAQLGGRRRRETLAAVTAMIRLADVVTAPSEGLVAHYRDLGAPDARVLENYLPREFAKVRRPRHDGVAIACLAALEHQVDYQQLGLRDTLARLLDEHPDLRVVSFGLGLGISSERYANRKGIPLLDLAQALAIADVGIAPIVDIPFNRARSNVKLKEYAAAGLAWLASPAGPYAAMGEQQGGRLVADGDWHAALERLIVDERERRKLAKRAAKWVKGEMVDQHAHRWETVLRDAIERARARAPRALAAR